MKRLILKARAQAIACTAGLALLISCGTVHAENTQGGTDKALLLPPSQEDQSVLKYRLQSAKRDIEAFRVFAENFRNNGNVRTLAQLQTPVEEFLKKHVDNLLTQSNQNANLETTRLTAEIMFIKARLFICLKRDDAARETLAAMKKRFGSYLKISVELPGKTTTLDEGIRLLDEELARTAAPAKKQGALS